MESPCEYGIDPPGSIMHVVEAGCIWILFLVKELKIHGIKAEFPYRSGVYWLVYSSADS